MNVSKKTNSIIKHKLDQKISFIIYIRGSVQQLHTTIGQRHNGNAHVPEEPHVSAIPCLELGGT